MNNTQQKHIVVVLGMHRSGTSAITRGLQVLGVDLGDSLTPSASDNEKGFWEDQDINALNIDLLKALGHDWHTLTPILADELTAPITGEFKLRAVEVLRNKLNATHCFGLKDPRIARVLPFWQSVFDHLQVRVSYVIACRNPMSVVRSLAKRDGFDLEKGYYLWLEHTLSSLMQTTNNTRIVVDYDRLIEDPAEQLRRISQTLGLAFNPEGPEFDEYQTQFLEDSLRHTRYRVEDLKLDKVVPPTVSALYITLLELAADILRFDDVRLTSILERISEQVRENYAALHYMQACANKAVMLASQLSECRGQIANLNQAVAERDAQIANLNQTIAVRGTEISNLTQALAEHEEQVAMLYRSTSWRITTPIRWLGGQIRRVRCVISF